MNVLIISQCSKKAREQSCRILDQFAERKGATTWQTAITQQGLDTLRRLLRKTARRNTAIACHWLKKSGQSELLWIVGNLRRFNASGTVPTNRTSRNILRSQYESSWRSTESIALMAGIAGLFHDFGKAGALFQDGITNKTAKKYQPFRHEWISVRLFQAFIGEQSDREWLERLGTLNEEDETAWLERLHRDNRDWSNSPFIGMPPLAQVIAWLILSHHRLPQYNGENDPPITSSETWLTNQLNVEWNALNHQGSWEAQDFQRVWTFPQGTPLRSRSWRNKAQQLAKRALHAVSLQDFSSLEQTFTIHLARLALMLADHYYSSGLPVTGWQDNSYHAWANRDRKTGKLKQKLDEHTVGVSHHAFLLGRAFPRIRSELAAITRHKRFRQRAQDTRFHWQNKAWDIAESLRESSREQGFFGINMASTGCGKTLANARIMYALSQEEEGCRFTIALGLRTLTLQTGDALRARLGLGEDDLAVLIGSRAVRELHQKDWAPDVSSASAEAIFEPHQYVHYDGVSNNGALRQWLDKEIKLRQLVDAPVLVATIDHLMPATEGVRGGRQIAPMLRLLTSDLVLDEPDDFGIDDQHALCRLVNWSGMLGGRVLLSSATLPPALVQALFVAYITGRKAYQAACGEPGKPLNVCCAWFDEDDARSGQFSRPEDFYQAHSKFARRRAESLVAKPALRRAELVNVSSPSSNISDVVTGLAGQLHGEILRLHDLHAQPYGKDKRVSLGLIRMANINPLVATARVLLSRPSPEDYCIHYCVYHSQHPLAVRSHIEKQLDDAFTRNREKPLALSPEIVKTIEREPARHHIFVVLGTSVIEVGRDWDADWGIIEPSSMRSLIQFAGRIQRHRQQPAHHNNLLILSKNVRALGNKVPAYCKPGFENARFLLNSHDLTGLLTVEQYRFINAVPRIIGDLPRQGAQYNSLVTLEHARSWKELLATKEDNLPVAAHWWRKPLNWNGELQRRQPFRRTGRERQFFLRMEDAFDTPVFMEPNEGTAGWKDPGIFKYLEPEIASGVASWVNTDYATVLLGLAESYGLELPGVSEIYGEVTLRSGEEDGHEIWLWHPLLGVFRALD